MHMMETPAFRTAAPNKANILCTKKVRISLITDRLVRFEYAADGKFEDRQTLAILNRDLGKVPFKKTVDKKGNLRIETDALVIELKNDGKPLTEKNLQVSFQLNGKRVLWFPGLKSKGNLQGTARTLDRCDGDWFIERDPNGKIIKLHKLEICDGLLSKEGWSVFDDHDSVALDKINKEKWITPREDKEYQDFYLLAYGHDYKKALGDAAGLFGSQPLAPRYVLGYWYNRYWTHTDTEFEEILDEMDKADAPIDVVVVDMDWHLQGWTGYTWEKRYFPDPDDFLKEMHRRGCRVSLNLHPADGVAKYEEKFNAMAKAMGVNLKKTDRIPFAITDQKYMKNYFELLHHPEEKRGVDFWWMDWQQGTTTPMRHLDTLPWLNHLHWEDMQKQGKRPLIFSRFGGVGAGRYVIGFSGDTISDWKSLAYQPWFTATASNILFGTWSHDIGGHMPGAIAPELYLRWIQFGIWSPILRTHTTKNFLAERRFAAFQNPYRELIIQQLRNRYEMVPYIYSENRNATDTGVSLLSPLYYDWPEAPKAYTEKTSYLFGCQYLISPVVSPVNKKTNMATKNIWLPEGKWFDVAHGQILEGNQTYNLDFMLEETPVFAREGAIVPGERGVRRLTEKSYSNLVVNVYPGASGSYDMYEDDGLTPDYMEKNHAYIRFAHSKTGKVRTVTVQHLSGNFKGFLSSRALEFRLYGVVPPKQVSFNGKKAQFVYRFEDSDAPLTWRYDGKNATLIVRVAAADIKAAATLQVTYPVADEFTAAAGLPGFFRRLAVVTRVANAIASDNVYDPLPNERLAQELFYTWNRISRKPETFTEEMANLQKQLPLLPETLNAVANRFMKITIKNISYWLPKYLDQAKAVLASITEQK